MDMCSTLSFDKKLIAQLCTLQGASCQLARKVRWHREGCTVSLFRHNMQTVCCDCTGVQVHILVSAKTTNAAQLSFGPLNAKFQTHITFLAERCCPMKRIHTISYLFSMSLFSPSGSRDPPCALAPPPKELDLAARALRVAARS